KRRSAFAGKDKGGFHGLEELVSNTGNPPSRQANLRTYCPDLQIRTLPAVRGCQARHGRLRKGFRHPGETLRANWERTDSACSSMPRHGTHREAQGSTVKITSPERTAERSTPSRTATRTRRWSRSSGLRPRPANRRAQCPRADRLPIAPD